MLVNKLGQCREHCVYVYVVARATQTDPKIMNCIFSHCRLTRFLNDDVYASAWCALVSFRLLAHLPLFVTCRTQHGWPVSEMNEQETSESQLRLYLCISVILQCMSTGIPRWHRGRLLDQLYKRLCGLLTLLAWWRPEGQNFAWMLCQKRNVFFLMEKNCSIMQLRPSFVTITSCVNLQLGNRLVFLVTSNKTPVEGIQLIHFNGHVI